MVAIYRSEVSQAREGLGAAARPWERTGSIDVERLVNWAYVDQMVDRFERTGLHAIEASAAGFEARGYSADGVGQMMQIGHLGCRIDGGGVRVTDNCHPVALAVAGAVSAVRFGDSVVQYAKAGARPQAWIEPDRKARASVWVKHGVEAQVEYLGPGRKGAYCPVIITWDKARADWGREDYARWWRGLDDLAFGLSARALGFLVTGPAAAMEPWAARQPVERGSQETPPNGSSHRSGL